ncbi:MAG: TfoX/Sxy family protein [Bacteroidota bacterium]
MAFDPELHRKINAVLELLPHEIAIDVRPKKMFGGIAFLFQGKMTLGIVKRELMVRVISSKMEETLRMKGVRPMDFTNRPMKEFVFVDREACNNQEQILSWFHLGLEHAQHKLKNPK